MAQQILQVAGFSNSGKTTLVEKFIAVLTKQNIRVGTIKHHGHGGELTTSDSGKDSFKHRQAGAIVSGVVSKGTLQLNVVKAESWQANELISLYSQFPLDVVVIEGFKGSPFPKVVIIKEEAELSLLTKLKNIVCVISWISLPSAVVTESIAYFQIDEETKYINFIVEKLKGQDNE